MYENWGEKKYFEQSNTDLLKAWVWASQRQVSNLFFM